MPRPVAPSAINEEFFIARLSCPACNSRSISELNRCSFTADPVRSNIASSYELQGWVDWPLLEGTDSVFCECDECGLIYQQNAPNDRLLDRIYTEMVSPEFLERSEEQLLTVDNFNQVAGELGVLFRLSEKPPSKITFLDYGFGHGRWARVARALGAKVFATEIADKRSLAASIGVEIVSDEDVDRMRFEIVHTEQVFEHLVNPARDFRRLAAVTDGIMKVAVPKLGNVRDLLLRKGIPGESPIGKLVRGERLTAADNTYQSVGPLEHINVYAPRSIERLARDNNMQIVSRVRRASVALDLTAPSLVMNSLLAAGKMLAKMIIAPDRGYYILRPRAKIAQ